MPDLNLADEDSSLETTDETESTEESEALEGPERGKGGGLLKILMIVLIVIIGLGASAYLLNSLGIVKLWGKKAKLSYTQELTAEEGQMQTEQQATSTDQQVTPPTEQQQMIETPPLEETKKETTQESKPTPVEKKEPLKKPVEKKEPAKKPVEKKESAKPKEEKPVKPMPNAPATASKLTDMSGTFTIQVSAFQDKAKADKMAKRLTDAGYPAYVAEKQTSKGLLHVVRIGKYASLKEAQTAVQGFAQEIKASHYIDRVKTK
ncbi:MAG: SPOR domain-containing protein [bacterium]